MSENSKLVKTLEMLIFVSSGLRYTIKEIAERFEITERYIYRYLHDLREVGFIFVHINIIDMERIHFRNFSLAGFSFYEGSLVFDKFKIGTD